MMGSIIVIGGGSKRFAKRKTTEEVAIQQENIAFL